MKTQIIIKSFLKVSILGLCFLLYNAEFSQAQSQTSAEQQIIALSKNKWQWMADKNVDSLSALFDEKSVFVHMGGSWGKSRELDVIKSGGIWYKKPKCTQFQLMFLTIPLSF